MSPLFDPPVTIRKIWTFRWKISKMFYIYHGQVLKEKHAQQLVDVSTNLTNFDMRLFYIEMTYNAVAIRKLGRRLSSCHVQILDSAKF